MRRRLIVATLGCLVGASGCASKKDEVWISPVSECRIPGLPKGYDPQLVPGAIFSSDELQYVKVPVVK